MLPRMFGHNTSMHSQKGPSACFTKIGTKSSSQHGSLEFMADGNFWDLFARIKVFAMPLRDMVAECIHGGHQKTALGACRFTFN